MSRASSIEDGDDDGDDKVARGALVAAPMRRVRRGCAEVADEGEAPGLAGGAERDVRADRLAHDGRGGGGLTRTLRFDPGMVYPPARASIAVLRHVSRWLLGGDGRGLAVSTRFAR